MFELVPGINIHENNPHEGSSWTEVKARIKKQF
jgi:hypothetical protein